MSYVELLRDDSNDDFTEFKGSMFFYSGIEIEGQQRKPTYSNL